MQGNRKVRLISYPVGIHREDEIRHVLRKFAIEDAKSGPPQPTDGMVRQAIEAPYDEWGQAIEPGRFSPQDAERIYREEYQRWRKAYAEGGIRNLSEEVRKRKIAARAYYKIPPEELLLAGQNHLISAELVNVASLAMDLLRQGYHADQIREAILEANRRGLWELQADTGIGRFAREQLALLPPGPRGTHLTSARILKQPEPKAKPKARTEKVKKMRKPRKTTEEKAQEKAQKAAAREAIREAKKAAAAANREAKKAAAAQEKAAKKAALAAQKAADREASKAQKKAAVAAARQARKEAKKAEALAARKVNEAARAATIRGEEPPPFEIEEWEQIPFTADALLAASPEDARKLIGRAGRGQRAALRRQLRGELRSLRQQISMLKKARRQRIKVIRARCRDAARQIRERMRVLREEFLRAWKALKAEDAERKQACSADLRQVMEEIGPALANAAQRQARVAELAGEIAKLSARRQLTRKMIEGRESAQDRLHRSDALVRRDLEHFLGNEFPAAVKWWDLKGSKMAELKPGKVPERMSRSELVMHYVQENTGEIMRFLDDHEEKEIARQEKELAKKEREYQRIQSRRAIQRAGRARRMGSPGRNRMQIEERRRKFYEDAPF